MKVYRLFLDQIFEKICTFEFSVLSLLRLGRQTTPLSISENDRPHVGRAVRSLKSFSSPSLVPSNNHLKNLCKWAEIFKN